MDTTEFLESFRAANSNILWTPPETPIIRFGINMINPGTEKALQELAHQKSHITLLPVISWPVTDSALRSTIKTQIAETSQRIANRLNKDTDLFDVSLDVVKVNYTRRSSPHRSGFDGKTSFFVGKIIPGNSYVLVDDRIDMGSTMRDLWRYVESQGGKVIGVLETSNNSPAMPWSPFPFQDTLDKRFFPVLWGALNNCDTLAIAQERYAALGEAEKAEFRKNVIGKANEYFQLSGLQFSQITSKEWERMAESFLTEDGRISWAGIKTVDALFYHLTYDWQPKPMPDISTIAEPEKLLDIPSAVRQQLGIGK